MTIDLAEIRAGFYTAKQLGIKIRVFVEGTFSSDEKARIRDALEAYMNYPMILSEIDRLTARDTASMKIAKAILEHEWTNYESELNGICVYCGGHEHKIPEGRLSGLGETDAEYQAYLDEVNEWNYFAGHTPECIHVIAAALVAESEKQWNE